MNGLLQLYVQYADDLMAMFAPEIIYSMPTGSVVVGKAAVADKFRQLTQMNPGRVIRQRLLQTPESLPAGAMVIDQMVSSADEMQPANVRNLIVVKRREQDGLITSLTEEEGHRKATVPLAARVGSANLFNSPTDNMVSPCTSKLNLAKRRHHLKGKPTALFAGMSGGM